MAKQGSVLVAVMIILTGLMTVGIALTQVVNSSSIKIQRQYKRLSALAYAEAGVNKGLWKVDQNTDITWLTQAKGANGILETDMTGGVYRVKIKECAPVSADCKYIEATGSTPTEDKPDATKTVRVKINGVDNLTTLNFNYAAQSNANQISMSNNATIKGSAFSNGPIYMGNGASITGSATSTGTTPTTSYISGGKVSGNARAFTITGTTVSGTSTTGSYPATQAPPIAAADLDATIDGFEATATAGGITTGDVTINGTNSTLGPRQIDGNLTLTNNAELRLTGNVWVNGNISVSNNAKIYLDSSYGSNSGVIIADYRSNRADWTKGLISLSNGATISGIDKNNPKTPSYILMFSTQSPRPPAEPTYWKTYPAISVSNGVHGGVYYAPYGSYSQNNVAQVRAVIANGLVLGNNATLDYDGNWGNSGISSGPAGKWTITEWLILE